MYPTTYPTKLPTKTFTRPKVTVEVSFQGVTDVELLSNQDMQTAMRSGMATSLGFELEDVKIEKIGSVELMRRLLAGLVVKFVITVASRVQTATLTGQVKSLEAETLQQAIKAAAEGLGMLDFAPEASVIFDETSSTKASTKAPTKAPAGSPGMNIGAVSGGPIAATLYRMCSGCRIIILSEKKRRPREGQPTPRPRERGTTGAAN